MSGFRAYFVLFVLVLSLSRVGHAQAPGASSPGPPTNGWAWMGGSNTQQGCITLYGEYVCYTSLGVFGTEYSFDPANVPSSRSKSITWTDSEGRFWLYGGIGFDSAGTYTSLDDMWVFDPALGQQGEWAWMGGHAAGSTGPVYDAKYQFSAKNNPGSRYDAVFWTDQHGRLWVYGGGRGSDMDSKINGTDDLWVFDATQGANGEWAWMGGFLEKAEQLPVYGTKYEFADANNPGYLRDAVFWSDHQGRLWLFGGYGRIVLGPSYILEQALWVFDPARGAHGQWAWMGGDNSWSGIISGVREDGGYPGTYGTEFQFADSNIPGSRVYAASWSTPDGNMWLFGGLGFDSVGSYHENFLNDLWEFDPLLGAHGQWAWQSGSKSAPNCDFAECFQFGVYRSKYWFNTASVPGTRYASSPWTDTKGRIWLFSGVVNEDDLWVFDPAQGKHGEWCWMAGSKDVARNAPEGSVLGTEYQPSLGNTPGRRIMPLKWTDADGNLWLFGGQSGGFIPQPAIFLNDLWEFTLPDVAVAQPPTFNPPAGTYEGPQMVLISDISPGVTIYFTVDGSTPTTQSTPYTKPINMAKSGSLSAIAAGGSYSESPVATASYMITPIKPKITWPTPAAITFGTALGAAQLNAAADVPGTFAYSPAAGTVLPAGSQTLSTTFTPTDTENYATATATVTVVVKKATPKISWRTPAAIPYGTALGPSQLDAKVDVAGTFVYSPDAGTVLAVGSHKLTTRFTPTDTADYIVAGSWVTLTVNKAKPTITWSAPAAIPYGTPLGESQLNAIASTEGNFIYSPAAGTVLSIGSHTLTTTFTPTDLTSYDTITASVTLVVKQAVPSISVTSSKNPSTVYDPITFTATVSSSVGVPTGSVSFFDGSNQLGMSTLIAGTAAFTSEKGFAAGDHSLTAQYSGDITMAAATSAVLTQSVSTFALELSSGAPTSVTVEPGGTATYSLSATPPKDTAMTFAVTGLPVGASSSFDPTSIPAGAGATSVQLTIRTAAQSAAIPTHSTRGPLAFVLILLPLAGLRTVRRKLRSRMIVSLLAVICLAGLTTLCGCGGGSGSAPPPPPQTYNLTVTATAGAFTHSAKLTLTVQ